MLKMFPRPKRIGSGRDHAIVFVVDGWVPVRVYEGSVGRCILAFVGIEGFAGMIRVGFRLSYFGAFALKL